SARVLGTAWSQGDQVQADGQAVDSLKVRRHVPPLVASRVGVLAERPCGDLRAGLLRVHRCFHEP
ncbi:MAG: hypothetical protein AAF471_09665, partial [Myxococcota bacterium]